MKLFGHITARVLRDASLGALSSDAVDAIFKILSNVPGVARRITAKERRTFYDASDELPAAWADFASSHFLLLEPAAIAKEAPEETGDRARDIEAGYRAVASCIPNASQPFVLELIVVAATDKAGAIDDGGLVERLSAIFGIDGKSGRGPRPAALPFAYSRARRESERLESLDRKQHPAGAEGDSAFRDSIGKVLEAMSAGPRTPKRRKMDPAPESGSTFTLVVLLEDENQAVHFYEVPDPVLASPLRRELHKVNGRSLEKDELAPLLETLVRYRTRTVSDLESTSKETFFSHCYSAIIVATEVV